MWDWLSNTVDWLKSGWDKLIGKANDDAAATTVDVKMDDKVPEDPPPAYDDEIPSKVDGDVLEDPPPIYDDKISSMKDSEYDVPEDEEGEVVVEEAPKEPEEPEEQDTDYTVSSSPSPSTSPVSIGYSFTDTNYTDTYRFLNSTYNSGFKTITRPAATPTIIYSSPFYSIPSSEYHKKGGLPEYAVALIIILCAVILPTFLWCCCCKPKRQQEQQQARPETVRVQTVAPAAAAVVAAPELAVVRDRDGDAQSCKSLPKYEFHDPNPMPEVPAYKV